MAQDAAGKACREGLTWLQIAEMLYNEAETRT